MAARQDGRAEWLEADGLGGFASGTVSGTRTRRYHALLLSALTPPTGRFVLVNGFDAWVDTPGGSFPLSSQAYMPDAVHPDGARRIESFDPDPWPRWVFRLEDGTLVEQEIFVPKEIPAVAISWCLRGAAPPSARLTVRPFLSGRDYHALHHENGSFAFQPDRAQGGLVWRPYPGLPEISALTNGEYEHAPDWYRNFRYEAERERGLDDSEDLASPGVIKWDLAAGEAVLIFSAGSLDERSLDPVPLDGRSAGERDRVGGSGPMPTSVASGAAASLQRLRASELARRRALDEPLDRAAEAYIVRRARGKTVVAGYPWFTDWGRDTFIALRGLCLSRGRLEVARAILVEWASAVSEGMLPNLFPDGRSAPEYNSVDASLWYIVAVHDLLIQAKAAGKPVAKEDQRAMQGAVEAILDGYARGTRYGIRADADGLLSAGVPGVQLTWMDAKVGDWVVTPRIGKPVEIEALWLNALWIGTGISPKWGELFERGLAAFRERFWDPEGGHLHDVVDVDHRPGTVDRTFRPNQIFAVGGLPHPLLEGVRAMRIVTEVERRLFTPIGLRSLAPGEPGYAPRYEGGPLQRDGAYHQGTVWPWLMGPFVEAWVHVRGGTPAVLAEARVRFLEPLLAHLGEAGLGHISEIADADPPHTPRGCPFQAWSVGEALRLERTVLRGAGGVKVRPPAMDPLGNRKDRVVGEAS